MIDPSENTATKLEAKALTKGDDRIDNDMPLCECSNETVVPGTDSCRMCMGTTYTIYGVMEKKDGPEDKRGWWIFGVYDDGVAFRNGPYSSQDEAKGARGELYPASLK